MKKNTKTIRKREVLPAEQSKKHSRKPKPETKSKGKGKPLLAIAQEMYQLPTQSIIERLRAHLANLEPDLTVDKLSDQEVVSKLKEIVNE